jgi:hypothetical protein
MSEGTFIGIYASALSKVISRHMAIGRDEDLDE